MDIDNLINKHDGLLKYMSRRFHVRGYTHEDLYQEFAMVLLSCSKTFDVERKTKFRTYLYRSILSRAWQLIEKQEKNWVSLDENIKGSNNKYVDTLMDDKDTPDILDEKERAFILIMDELKELEQGRVSYEIICNNKTLEQVGRMLGVTKQRVYQIHKHNMGVLRFKLKDNLELFALLSA